ncbi:hypothetical protein EV702DRAFT_1267677 [Suillus placidus]|uniref:Uncharacterized protein n=1 Tax=Suillus placidus TaxID=48579 RepID=A0A9P7D487_9AGAM|nr:hypothetical protein EV702DRAFT_1267677 [Suillus placidus]
MPAVRQRARRSARLQANTRLRLRGMDPPPPSTSTSQPVSSDPGPRITVQWGKEDALTDILVDHITSHPADSRILFYSEGKKTPFTDGEQASGKDKSDIYAVLAKLIFANHVKHGAGYHRNPKKFCDSVANHIVGLKARYKKLKAKLGATGAGVLPGDRHANLLLEICAEWKWFVDLDAIWHSNPAFAVTSHSSRPGVDHAGQMYSLAQPLRGTAAGGTSRHVQGAAQPQPPPQPSCSASAQSFCGDHLIDPRLLQSSPALPDTPSPTFPDIPTAPSPPNNFPDPSAAHHAPPPLYDPPQVHLRGLSRTDNDLHRSNPFAAPLGDALDHLQDNDMMQEGGEEEEEEEEEDDRMQEDELLSYNSPPKVAGKKRRNFASPSPSPPHDPQPFHVPAKAPTNAYHSRAAFSQQPIRGKHKPLLMSRNLSTPSSTPRNTTPSSSSTPQTSVSAQVNGCKKKKKAKSDVQDQVENLTEEIESIQSDVMSLQDSKHQRFIVKLSAKSENQRETKKYNWLRDMRAHEASQAVLTHQREQENRAAEIRLREADIRVHEAHSTVLDKEAETLRLRIQYQQLMQGSSGST